MKNSQPLLALCVPGALCKNIDHATGQEQWRRVRSVHAGVITFDVTTPKGLALGVIRTLPTIHSHGFDADDSVTQEELQGDMTYAAIKTNLAVFEDALRNAGVIE